MPAPSELRMPRRLWDGLVAQLHARTCGETHESGAFLLGQMTENGRRVRDVLYFDDLHPEVHAGGVVELPAAAFRRLWAIVRQRGVQVVGDVHVHPHSARQSRIDRQNPLIATRGHVAIILPNFARPRIRRWSVGVYVYEGDHQWQAVGEIGRRFLVLEDDHE
ncbi:Mov34/MPN/PAD-1 family protein [Arenimonas sp. MALMAid1274]|uniref:Mov34/MPN/PAD-1 family protein n=1 Tax=Arenimonas sp. MALMAid1274 TaxID=3411630 RepID=UPI003BA30ADF